MDYDECYQKSLIHQCIDFSGIVLWLLVSAVPSVLMFNHYMSYLFTGSIITTLFVLAVFISIILMTITTLFVLIAFPMSLLDDYIRKQWISKHR